MTSDERALCGAVAAWLRAASVVGAFALGASAVAAALLLWMPAGAPRMAVAAAWLLLALGLVERALAFRIRFDADLFARLADGGSMDLQGLDRALHALGLRAVGHGEPRPVADRARGARRLQLQHVVIVVVQCLLAAALLMAATRI